MTQEQHQILSVPFKTNNLIKISNQLEKVKQSATYNADYIPHLSIEQVKKLAEAASSTRHGDRDAILIQLLFDGCLRCSEAVSLRPIDIESKSDGWLVRVVGKGNKMGTVAISASLAAQLQAYCYRHLIKPEALIFAINRSRVFQIVQKTMTVAGIIKPKGVGTVHVLRHSGALERLKVTSNPRAVQEQLRHKSAQMTLRYMKTLSHDECLEIQQSVDFKW